MSKEEKEKKKSEMINKLHNGNIELVKKLKNINNIVDDEIDFNERAIKNKQRTKEEGANVRASLFNIKEQIEEVLKL